MVFPLDRRRDPLIHSTEWRLHPFYFLREGSVPPRCGSRFVIVFKLDQRGAAYVSNAFLRLPRLLVRTVRDNDHLLPKGRLYPTEVGGKKATAAPR